jgi:predicted RNA-binding protein YlqC (UPF0109 family)
MSPWRGGTPGSGDRGPHRTDDAVVIELRVAPDDMGKVIGKQGRIAKSIRTLVKAATVKDEKPTFVEIV